MKKIEPIQLELIPSPPEQENESQKTETSIIKIGELWSLGNHKILIGDSRKTEDVENACGGLKIDYVFTSPPFGLNLQYEREQTLEELVELIRLTINNIHKVTKDDAYATINYSDVYRHGEPGFTLMSEFYHKPFKDLGWCLRGNRIWLKPFARLALSYATSTTMSLREWEYIYTWRKGRGREVLRDQGITARGVWKTFGEDAIISDWQKFDFTTDKRLHQAAFPLALPIVGLRAYTDEGDVVLEPFLGSGTSLFACEYMKRTCIGIDLEPRYIQRTLDLWLDFKGEEPIRLNDGATWSEVRKGKIEECDSTLMENDLDSPSTTTSI